MCSQSTAHMFGSRPYTDSDRQRRRNATCFHRVFFCVPSPLFFFLRSLSTRRVARVVLYLVGSFHEFFFLFPLAKRYQYVLLFFLLSLCDYYAMCLIAERCQYVLLLFLSCHSLRLLSHLFENLDQASVTPFLQKRSVVIWPVSFLDAMLCLRFISILYALSY